MFHIWMVENGSAPSDGAADVEALSRNLSEQGYVVDRLDWTRYCERLREGVVADLVLLDSELPEGLESCRKLKNTPETEHIPVIFYHGKGEGNGKVVKSLETGATDFLPLTGNPAELLARIQSALRQKQMLHQSRALAEQLNQMNNELYERNLQVEKELYTARQLQQSLLPPFLPDEAEVLAESPAMAQARSIVGKTPEPTAPTRFSKCHYRDENLRITGVYMPCDALGGDIYDVIQFPDKTIGVAIADVSGHGVPAGFVTAIFKSSFYRITHNYSAPKDILYHLNNELINIVKTGEYVTSVYMRLHPDQRTIDFTGAGHPYPLYYHASDGSVERLQENGTPLVWLKDMDYPMGERVLNTGDKILLFTDGISEMRNVRGDMFGEEALESLFKTLAREKPNDILNAMIAVLSDFSNGHPLEDDLSVVLIEAL